VPARRFISRIQHACAISAAKLQTHRDDSRHDVLADAGASRSGEYRETKRFAAQVLARADRLIAVSINTRCDAAQILRIPEERIEVIHHGVADGFFHVSPGETRAAASKHGLSRPYILFVGTLEPRKNVDTLIEGFLQLPPSMRKDVDLVLAGAMGWRSQQLAERLRAGIPGVRWLGYVTENDLAGLTAGAMVFAYPSLYEGFGLPVAQAMAAGVPVVTSNVSSLPEIAGDAAILVDPKSSLEISASLERLLLDPSLRQHLAANGVRKASAYRWDACAAKSLAFFHSV
jgi:glycosyltransferase involved in cell wall biosynthesis